MVGVLRLPMPILAKNQLLLQADVFARGYGGYNTRWALFLLHHIFPLESSKPPLATTVFFGANDAALSGRTSERQHVPIEEYKGNLRKIVLHLQECSPTMLIVLITPPPVCEEGRRAYAISLYGENASKLPERTNEATGQYAKACVEIAKEMGVRDGLHLTPEGNAVVYQEVIKLFNEAGLSAENMPYDFPHHSKIDFKNPQSAFQKNVCEL
ncbi:SGNH hydrolase superfamily [Sesbania bispinosa]|nr:SGNH hydrolase superfamily [Sesbania bispinosa]